MELTELNKTQKAAIVILSLGKEKAAKIFGNLDSQEIEKITKAISEISLIEPKTKEEVLKEFYQEVVSTRGGVVGGNAAVKEILEHSLGRNEASDYLNRLQQEDLDVFNAFKSLDIGQLSNFLHSERPQTIALIISHLEPTQAAQLIGSLPTEQQSEVLVRMATMSKTDPNIVAQVGTVVRKHLASASSSQLKTAGGAKSVAEILNFVDREAEKNIIAKIEMANAGLAEEIKKLMFVFEDIVLVDDRSMQKVLKEIDTSELSIALKSASDELKAKIFANISKRASELIKEEIEYMGPVRLKDVEEAQQRIVNVIRRLEESGEIMIAGRGGGGEKFV